MARLSLLVLLILALYLHPGQLISGCPTLDCACFTDGLIDCAEMGFKSMPYFDHDDYNVTYQMVDLSGNKIKRIGARSFDNVQMKKLKMTNNKAELDINVRAFRGLEDVLVNITIRRSRVKVLTPGLFRKMLKLREIDFSDNRITELRKGVFKGANNVVNVDLSNNYIPYLEPNVFSGLRSLKTLMLSQNNINMVDSRAFNAPKMLIDLSLSDNKIRDLQPRTFKKMKHLRRLDLSKNVIPALFPLMFRGLESLERLLLGSNPIIMIANDTFSSMINLRDLFIDEAKLHHVKAGMFNGLSNLRTLSLRTNAIAVLPNSVFATMKQLKRLWMNSNLLGTVNACAFADVHLVQEIKADDNPIHCDCAVRWTAMRDTAEVSGTCAKPFMYMHQDISMPHKYAVCHYSGLECIHPKYHPQNTRRWRF